MTIEKSSDLVGDYEIRLAGKEDANGISRLLQELLTFYGLPLKYQRSYMSHVIENEAFLENSGLKIFIALFSRIDLVKRNNAISGLPQGPYTVKKRSPVVGSP